MGINIYKTRTLIPVIILFPLIQVHPNPNRANHLKVKLYEFAGKIVGKCLYESALGGGYRQLVKAKFTRSFLAQLIGLRVNYKVRLATYHSFKDKNT